MTSPLFGIKVDVDTYRGMKEGVPRLIHIFSAHGIRASFFISMGPDNSGKAVYRFFTRRGFLKKMFRSNAVGMYGIRTALSGTLLPARQIARSFPDHFRMLFERGHEVGIHGYDHVKWHDRIPRMSREEAESEIRKACDIYREITGREPKSSAAPGWACSPDQLAIQDSLPMRYHSDSRGECPFLPLMNGKRFTHPQIPTTLPTLDELLGSGECCSGDDLSRYYIKKITTGQSHVLTIHAEAEGMGWAEWFDKLLGELTSKGVTFICLREIADESLSNPSRIPHCDLTMSALPGRAGKVAVQCRRCS